MKQLFSLMPWLLLFPGSFGLRRNLADFTFEHTGYLIFHYWL
jgi:hypothetical protein